MLCVLCKLYKIHISIETEIATLVIAMVQMIHTGD